MSSKIALLAITLVIIGLAVGLAVYIVSTTKKFPAGQTFYAEMPETNDYSQPLDEEAVENKADFPDVVVGTIKFLDTKTSIKTTITTEYGEEYILSPNQPKSIYESFGVQDGERVEVQGKIGADNALRWMTIKAIKD